MPAERKGDQRQKRLLAYPRLMHGEALGRPYRTVRWLNTRSLLPVQGITYVLDQKTGEAMRAYGTLFGTAGRPERSSLPAGFFGQEVPSGYRSGPVTNRVVI